MAWLDVHRPVRAQWYDKRNRPLTGCTVLHTAESVMDSVGPDTGAESVAEFIRTRTTAGSYHDLCDSDSAVHLIDYGHGAFHDGTGSNNWALSISWACRTTDWDRMAPDKRRAFMRQGAVAFARQQAWRRAVGAPLTELRLITKAQSDAGASGFTYHGLRDPGRRSDPGVSAPNDFPFAEFIAECRAVMAGGEDDMEIKELIDFRIEGRNLWDSLRQVLANQNTQSAAQAQTAAQVAALAQKVAQSGPAAAVAPEQVAAALAANPAFVKAIGESIGATLVVRVEP